MLIGLMFLLSHFEPIPVVSTAYCLTGHTATGTHPRLGTIAVDPRRIPLHSLMYVEKYGWGRARDTGGKIKGNRIDVWLPSRGHCMRWGRRKTVAWVMRRKK